MSTLTLSRILPRTLIAAAVMFSVANQAGAAVVYRWKTDDGVYAFTDDAKRIPEKYRAEAKATPMRPLQGYKNYTPAQRAGTQAHVKAMQESARTFSKLNQRLYGQAGVPLGPAYRAPSSGNAELLIGPGGRTSLQIEAGSVDDYSEAPITVQQQTFYVPGTNATRTNTIVRQGDRIIAVTKPRATQEDISTIPSESVLPQ